MKGTRLWQPTGSPLISGRSRLQRPFWQPWLLSSLVAGVFVAAWFVLAVPHSALGISGLMFAGALVGAAGGVWVSRLAGWSASWVVGVACGVVCAALVLAVWSIPVFTAIRQVR